MSQAFKLYRLQQLDSQIDRNRLRLDEIRLALADDHELRLAQAGVAAAEQTLQNQRKALHKAEDQVKDQRIKIEQTEAALYGGKVRNPKELQDLQNEAAALKRYLSVLEDRELEIMLAEEEANSAFQEAQAALEQTEARQAQRDKLLEEEKSHLLRDLPNLEDERQATAGSIPATELSMYEALRKTRRGLAVTLVQNKACSSCGTTLNATLLDAALTSGQINRCDGCGRILYVG
jgi:uncharacterized protein